MLFYWIGGGGGGGGGLLVHLGKTTFSHNVTYKLEQKNKLLEYSAFVI